MKQIILDPLIFSLLITVALIYAILGFHYINRNKQISSLFEQIYTIAFIITISGITIGLFGKFDPTALYLEGKTLPSYVLQLGTYGACLAFTLSRLRHSLKDIIFVLSKVITESPFFCLLVLMVALSGLWSQTAVYTTKASVVFLGVTAFFVYIGKQYKMKGLFNLVLWSYTILMLLSVFYAVFKPSVGASLGSAWNGVFDHKNQFAFVMSLTTVLLYIQSLRVPKYKLQFWGLTALSALAAHKADSGMGKILLIVLVVQLVLIYFIKRLNPRLAFAAMVFFLAIGICVTILITENAEYIIVEKLGKDMTLTGRTKFWPLIVNAINRYPLLGYGYEGFWQPWRGNDNPGLAIRTASLGNFIPMHSHNGFLDLALAIGWLGLIVFIFSLLGNIYKAVLYMKRHNEPEALLPLTILTWIVMTNITEIGLISIDKQWIFYVLITVRLSLDTVGESLFSSTNIRPQESSRLMSQSHR